LAAALAGHLEAVANFSQPPQTSQVIGEALGLSLPHSRSRRQDQPVWTDMAWRSADALHHLEIARHQKCRDILTPASIHNAMVLHAAFGGSTNLLLHVPAIAHAAGLRLPTVEDWIKVNRRVLDWSASCPTARFTIPRCGYFWPVGVPEVMLHLRRLDLLDTTVLDRFRANVERCFGRLGGIERRLRFREILQKQDNINPDDVIFSPETARQKKLTTTVIFPTGNIAPEGSVIKSAALDPSLIDTDNTYRKPARSDFSPVNKKPSPPLNKN